MRRTRNNRRAFIDRLEKKYMKKVQLQAFNHESEQLKHRLESLAGSNLRTWRQGDMDLTDIPDYKLNYSH